MWCPKCGTENREGARFCGTCGTLLILTCAQCGAELPPDLRFCDACGAQLSVPPAEVEEEPGVPGLDEAIQRLVPKEFAERLLATRGSIPRRWSALHSRASRSR